MFPCCQGLDTRLIRPRGRAAAGGRSRDGATTDDLWDTGKAASSPRSLQSLTHTDVVTHVLMNRYTHKTDGERETEAASIQTKNNWQWSHVASEETLNTVAQLSTPEDNVVTAHMWQAVTAKRGTKQRPDVQGCFFFCEKKILGLHNLYFWDHRLIRNSLLVLKSPSAHAHTHT